jgi:hypothetical protein
MDKNVVAIFAKAGQAGHPNWMDPTIHGPAYNDFAAGVPTALQCTTCHGADLLGQSIAPSCAACHAAPPIPADLTQLGGHFVATGHNSGACARCHAGAAFRDFIGADGTPSAVTTLGYTSTGGVVCTTPATPTTPGLPAGCSVDNATFAAGMSCDMCHNGATVLGNLGGGTPGTLNQHRFPSGNLVTMDGKAAICSQCHDGGRPGYEVSQLAVNIGATLEDAQIVGAGNKTVRAHYLPAASFLFGAEAANASQITGNIYTARNQHGGKASCSDCHNPHNGSLPPDSQMAATCGKCHFNEAGASVSSFLELEEVRQFGFEGDIDGDGTSESVKVEIEGMMAKAYAAIRAYATGVAGTDICYLSNRMYLDNGAGGGIAGNGICEVGETTSVCSDGVSTTSAACTAAGGTMSVVEYNRYTPRLLKAGYNYMLVANDPGAWAHNPRYAVEVLYDTIAQLNLGLTTAGRAAVPNGKRAFNGHFGAAEDPSPYAAMFYHGGVNATTLEVLPTMGFTSAACYQCHGGSGGLAAYLATAPADLPTSAMANKVTAFQCSTCHVNNGRDMASIRNDIATVYFPPQKPLPASNAVAIAANTLPKSFALCATCHSGRENATSAGATITANYALSATGLVATAGTTTSVDVASTGWANNRYKFARVTFTSGANLGTSVVVSGSTATTAGASTISWAAAAALPSAVVAGDTFDVVFDASTWGIGFLNPHYLGAAGVLLGSRTHMLYEYPAQTYAGNPFFWGSPHGSPHGAECTGCHQPKASRHGFEVDLAYCATCHVQIPGVGDYRLSPLKTNVDALAALLYATVTAYSQAAGNAVCYNGAAYPYWFADNGTGGGVAADGICQAGEAVSANSAKLNAKAALAAYNYKWSQAEPGAYAHNYEYIVQILMDAIVDLNPTAAMPNDAKTGAPIVRP